MKNPLMPIPGMSDWKFFMMINMPVYHKDGGAHMTVRQVLPTGNEYVHGLNRMAERLSGLFLGSYNGTLW